MRITVEKIIIDSFLSNTYLVYSAESLKDGCAVVVDPHYSEDLEQKLVKNGISNVLALLTHEHFDHTTGVNWLCRNYETTVYCQKICAEKIASIRNNRPLSIMGIGDDLKKYYYAEHYVCHADRTFIGEEWYDWHGLSVYYRHTPGHTEGSACIEIDNLLFTGDSLIIGEKANTRFPGGSQKQYEQYTLPYLLGIEKEKIIEPGHGISDVRFSDLIYADGIFTKNDER